MTPATPQGGHDDGAIGAGQVAFRCWSTVSRPFDGPINPLSGPFVTAGLAKDKSSKGEDKWLVRTDNEWVAEGLAGADGPVHMPFSAYGVFDGHGGRHVATFTANHLLGYVLDAVDMLACERVAAVRLSAASVERVAEGGTGAVDAGLGGPQAPSDSDEEDRRPSPDAVCAAQDLFAGCLPAALAAGFERCGAEARLQFRTGGGTTATLLFVVGWHIVVASVGDSLAVADTGVETRVLSVTHRLDDSESERQRVTESGSEVAQATVNGVPVGPLRVWPGGLAMSRTLGDAPAGDAVIATPDVCRAVASPDAVTRLIIASDGLWDALGPRAATGTARGFASPLEAAQRLLAAAIKKDKLRDDVTVVVIDLSPAGCPRALLTARGGARHAGPGAAPALRVWAGDGDGASAERAAARCRGRLWRALEARREVLEPPGRGAGTADSQGHDSAEVEKETSEPGHHTAGAKTVERDDLVTTAAVRTPTLHEELLSVRVSLDELQLEAARCLDEQSSSSDEENGEAGSIVATGAPPPCGQLSEADADDNGWETVGGSAGRKSQKSEHRRGSRPPGPRGNEPVAGVERVQGANSGVQRRREGIPQRPSSRSGPRSGGLGSTSRPSKGNSPGNNENGVPANASGPGVAAAKPVGRRKTARTESGAGAGAGVGVGGPPRGGPPTAIQDRAGDGSRSKKPPAGCPRPPARRPEAQTTSAVPVWQARRDVGRGVTRIAVGGQAPTHGGPRPPTRDTTGASHENGGQTTRGLRPRGKDSSSSATARRAELAARRPVPAAYATVPAPEPPRSSGPRPVRQRPGKHLSPVAAHGAPGAGDERPEPRQPRVHPVEKENAAEGRGSAPPALALSQGPAKATKRARKRGTAEVYEKSAAPSRRRSVDG